MSVYEEVCQQQSAAAAIHRALTRLLDEAERPSDKAVLKDAKELAGDLFEKLFQARVVTNPRG